MTDPVRQRRREGLNRLNERLEAMLQIAGYEELPEYQYLVEDPELVWSPLTP